MDADLLLHVIDASSPDAAAQHATVVSILRQLGMTSTQLSSKAGTSTTHTALLSPSGDAAHRACMLRALGSHMCVAYIYEL